MPVVQESLINHNDVILFQLNSLDRGSTEIWQSQQTHTLHRRCQHNSDTNHFPDVRRLHHLVKRQEPLHQIKQDVTSFEKTNIYNLLSLLKNWSCYFSTSSVMRPWWWTSAATNRGETRRNNNSTLSNKQGENNDIVTVTEIHMNTCDGLDDCVNNNNLTGHYATNNDNNDIVTVTEIHRNTCDGLDGCVNNNNWTLCNKQGEQWYCDSHRDSQEHLWWPWWLCEQ